MASKNNTKFTGGDTLTGIYQLYHQSMMKNELYNGYGAYQLSYAGGKSGLSFGGNQMDMSEAPGARKLFVKILNLATDKIGKAYFSEKEIKKIVGENNATLSIKGQSPKTIFGDNLDKINAALTSEQGKKLINDVYVETIFNQAEYIDIIVEHIHNPAAKAFYSTDLGKMLLFDYHNQYNLELHGAFLEKYIHGESNHKAQINFTTGEKITAPTDIYTLDDHKAYIRSTKQWFQNESNCEHRLDNIEQIFLASESHSKVLLLDQIVEQPNTHDFIFDIFDGSGDNLSSEPFPTFSPILFNLSPFYDTYGDLTCPILL